MLPNIKLSRENDDVARICDISIEYSDELRVNPTDDDDIEMIWLRMSGTDTWPSREVIAQ